MAFNKILFILAILVVLPSAFGRMNMRQIVEVAVAADILPVHDLIIPSRGNNWGNRREGASNFPEDNLQHPGMEHIMFFLCQLVLAIEFMKRFRIGDFRPALLMGIAADRILRGFRPTESNCLECWGFIEGDYEDGVDLVVEWCDVFMNSKRLDTQRLLLDRFHVNVVRSIFHYLGDFMENGLDGEAPFPDELCHNPW